MVNRRWKSVVLVSGLLLSIFDNYYLITSLETISQKLKFYVWSTLRSCRDVTETNFEYILDA